MCRCVILSNDNQKPFAPVCIRKTPHQLKCVCWGDERRADISNHRVSRQTSTDVLNYLVYSTSDTYI